MDRRGKRAIGVLADPLVVVVRNRRGDDRKDRFDIALVAAAVGFHLLAGAPEGWLLPDHAAAGAGTDLAITLPGTNTVQLAVLGRSELGSSVIELVPLPLTEKVCGLLSHEIVNELVVTSTASLKLTARFAVGSTLLAKLSCVVLVKTGAEPGIALTQHDALRPILFF